MRITKRELKRQIELMDENIKMISQTNRNLKKRIEALENPYKFKVGQIIGKYTIVRFLGHIYINPISMHKENRYEVIVGDEVITVSETTLSKKHNKLNE